MGRQVKATDTRSVVDTLYAAFLAGEPEGMLATMSDQIEVRFLGRGTYRGIDEARAFLDSNTKMLLDLEFSIDNVIVDGEWAATVWSEKATTVHGDQYSNHGVDVFRVVDGRVAILHENNDVLRHRSAFGYQSPSRLQGGDESPTR